VIAPLFSSTWAIRLLSPLLLGLAVAFVAAGAWDLRMRPRISAVQEPSVLPAVQGAKSWAGVILDKNILSLDVPAKKSSAPSSSTSALADLTRWRLLGTVTGGLPRALLRVEDEFVILEQDHELQGWELTKVRRDFVEFTAGGRTETVLLWARRAEDEPAALPRPTGQMTGPPAAGTRVSLSRADVRPLLSDPNSLLQMASFKPFSVDGRVSGFQVFSIRPDSLLSKVGLRNGDVLMRINGQTLSGPTQLLQAYSGMDRASLITLDVQRASQLQTYIVEVQ
jgi:type II secretion system protein C